MTKIGRNAPCPCGSQKKYKRCCGAPAQDESASQYEGFSPPELENRFYAEDSDETRYLLDLGISTALSGLKFGNDIHSRALSEVDRRVAKLGSQDVGSPDYVVLAFHAKGLDLLRSICALTTEGCIGPVMGMVRNLFELFVYQTYLLEKETPKRVKAYREHVRRETEFYDREVEIRSVPSVNAAQRRPPLNRPRQHWTGFNLHQLATRLKLFNLYTAVYRGGSTVLHSMDAENYNPVVLQALSRGLVPVSEPYFSSNGGLYAAVDAFTIIHFNVRVPWCMFANTADYFQLDLLADEKDRVSYLRKAISDEHTAVSASFDEVNELFPDGNPST